MEDADAAWAALQRLDYRPTILPVSHLLDAEVEQLPSALMLVPMNTDVDASRVRAAAAALRRLTGCVEHVGLAAVHRLAPVRQLALTYALAGLFPSCCSLFVNLPRSIDPLCMCDALAAPHLLQKLHLALPNDDNAVATSLPRLLRAWLPRLTALRDLSFSVDDQFPGWLPLVRAVASSLPARSSIHRFALLRGGDDQPLPAALWRVLADELIPRMSSLLALEFAFITAPAGAPELASLARLTQLRLLDLGGVVTSAAAGRTLAGAIVCMPDLRALNLGASPADAVAELVCPRVLQHTPLLTRLELIDCGLFPATGVTACLPLLPLLDTLIVEAVDPSDGGAGGDAGLVALATALQSTPRLRRLQLICEYGAAGDEALMRALAHLPQLEHSPMPCTARGIVTLLEHAAPHLATLSRVVLNLPGDMAPNDVDAVSAALEHPQPHLTDLSVVVDNVVGAAACAAACLANKPALERLLLRLAPSTRPSVRASVLQALTRCIAAGAAPQLKFVDLHNAVSGAPEADLAALMLALHARGEALDTVELDDDVVADAPDTSVPLFPAILQHRNYLLRVWPPVSTTQRYGIAEVVRLPFRVWTLFELAATAVLGDQARDKRLDAPRELQRAALLRRLDSCVACHRYVAEPAAPFLYHDRHAGVLFRCVMCPVCYHADWLTRTDVDQSPRWYASSVTES